MSSASSLEYLIPQATRCAYCAACESMLLDAQSATPLIPGRSFAHNFPPLPGVYTIFQHSTLIYVGQSGSLQGRIRDLCDTRNHNLRRTLGAHLFSTQPDFTQATSRRKFSPRIEDLLNTWMQQSLRLCALPIAFARSEVEERLIDRHQPRFNVRTRRA